MQQVAENIAHVRERIAAAAHRAGRSADQITLIAVTKTHPADVVEMALAAGVADWGENRVQEADEKIAALGASGVRWHLIGHLQRNKAKRAVTLFDLIHSLDSIRLAETLDRHLAESAAQLDVLSPQQAHPGMVGETLAAGSSGHQRRLPVLLQVNVSGEETKEGFALPGGLTNSALLPDFYGAVERIVALPQLEVQGLMTIAPYTSDPEAARPTFRTLAALRDDLSRRFPHGSWHQLSMGMTGDFEVAIEEGATLVRVGRAIFGERG